MTLEEFVKETKNSLNAFEKDYLLNHSSYPEEWPLEMEADNDRVWLEMFLTFEEEKNGRNDRGT